MTNDWEPEHYAAFAVLVLEVPLLLVAEFAGSHALQFHLLAIALWGLPVILTFILCASVRTGVVSYRGIRSERRNEPFVYRFVVAAQAILLVALILLVILNPLWKR